MIQSIHQTTSFAEKSPKGHINPQKRKFLSSLSLHVFFSEKVTDLPPTYATLPTIKLEEELNPFDQSFEGATAHTASKENTFVAYKTVKKNEKTEEDLKRKNFLERNRIAALKCRQRKKQWLENLQSKVEFLTNDNEQYHLEINALRQELIRLKSLLLAHKDCSINQQAISHALSQPIPGLSQSRHSL
ncbi:hypothetical protein BY458DRAFT_446985 [Sporodiniella umbellata]|nr:hypothetical protein BY458DRAFT_446985 [Sporodiniella umbellata]